MVQTYWEIGRQIVEYEQRGNERAEYGSDVLNRLSRDLTDRYGKGFSHSNVVYMRKLYLSYPKSQTLSNFLTWSHYIELLKIDDPLERSFYEKECEEERWGVRELKRQMKSMLFHRLALSADKQEVLKLAAEGQIVEKPEDILKEPYVFEFTGLPQLPVYEEIKKPRKPYFFMRLPGTKMTWRRRDSKYGLNVSENRMERGLRTSSFSCATLKMPVCATYKILLSDNYHQSCAAYFV